MSVTSPGRKCFASRAGGIIDQTHGGIRGAPKFPNPSILELLWRASLRTGNSQIGALVMKLLGTTILWSFIGVTFFSWYAKEEAEARGPSWREVEEELQEMGLNPKQ